MEPFLLVEEDGISVYISYSSAFTVVNRGRRPAVPKPPETIEGKSVSFSPLDSVQQRIESACCITDAAIGKKSHSKSKICCVCGRHGLSDDSKDNKFIFAHLRHDCPGAADLARLMQAIEASGKETGVQLMWLAALIDALMN